MRQEVQCVILLMLVSSFPQLKLDLLSIFGDRITDETLCCCYTSENN